MNWTQDEAIAFESAREVITSLMGIQTHQIEEERQKGCPDEERIAQLHDYRAQLADERAGMHVQDHEKIARIRREYGAVIRAWRAEHRVAVCSCPRKIGHFTG